MIWAKVRWPSQRSSIRRPVSRKRSAPSGYKITRSRSATVLFSAPQRQPVARRGWLESSGGATLASLNAERAGRWPSRLHVHIVHRELRIFRRLIQPGLEVIQTPRQPRIVLPQFVYAQGDQLGRKQFRQRRSDCFQQRAAANDIQIFIHRKACSRKNPFTSANLSRIETSGLRQLYPTLDTAFAGSIAIVIDYALAPRSAEDRVRTARQDNRILNRDDALIVIAVQRPGLQLAAAQLAFVHQQMKRVLVMVALLASGL